MKTMAAGEFKARCLQVMDQVHRSRTPVVITKRGKPVAKLVPLEEVPEPMLGRLKGQIEILGDIVSPITPLEDWEDLK
ncbi:MAG TPA: type II toxin-antitoxin system Phd/YefM family antitoxin [Candidatus Sulfotelmatobacter sp.]|nr:type II toxin-antitoxin system Phd/YefM family antitoxin [Candidatus Sulfotelmatobacter sp.]